MAILTETLQDIRSSGLPSLAQATDDDLRKVIRGFNALYRRYQGTHYQAMLDEVLRTHDPQ